MRSLRSAAAAGALLAALLIPDRSARAAGNDPAGGVEEVVSGEVISATSRWARGRTEIVTESVIRTRSGREVTVRQRGGSVDGVRMVELHAEPLLRAGDRVSARVAVARDRRGRESRPVRGLYALGGAGSGPGGIGSIPYVRTEATQTRAQVYWESGCAKLSFDEAGDSQIEGDLEFDEMERVLLRWQHAVEDCSYFYVSLEGRKASEVGLDGVNIVKFREDRWCVPATDEEPEDCHDPSAAGLTTLHFIDDADSDRNGALLDADIELNAINFRVTIDGQPSDGPPCSSDLANTFTHEVGHLMGLDHTCWISAGVRLEDDEGEPLPLCSLDPNLPDEVRNSTMFNFQDCGETKKGTPESDDVAGICAIYPLEDDPRECRAAELKSGGCAISTGSGGGSGSGPVALLSLAGLALVLRRRRR